MENNEKPVLDVKKINKELMEDEKTLREKLERLSKCKGLSKEDLQGRYKKAYENLKMEIKGLAESFLRNTVIQNLRWYDLDLEPYLAAVNEVNLFTGQDQVAKAILKEISHTLYTDCSFEAFHTGCLKMREQVKHILWKYAPEDWDSIEMEAQASETV